MIRFISLTAVALAILVVGGVGAKPAMAGGYHNKHHHGHYDGHAGHHYPRIPFVYELGRVIGAFLPHGRPYYSGGGSYYHRDHHRYRGGHSYRHRDHHYYRGNRYYAPPRAYSHRPAPRHHQYSRHGSGCHAVSKTKYHHGRLAKVGGTMCYDSYGNPYVVSGSRYVMHYYD